MERILEAQWEIEGDYTNVGRPDQVDIVAPDLGYGCNYVAERVGRVFAEYVVKLHNSILQTKH